MFFRSRNEWLLSPIVAIQRHNLTSTKMLKQYGMIASMSGKGNCYDNAPVVACYKTIKAELLWRIKFETRSDAESVLFYEKNQKMITTRIWWIVFLFKVVFLIEFAMLIFRGPRQMDTVYLSKRRIMLSSDTLG